jgi:hypothetical protein
MLFCIQTTHTDCLYTYILLMLNIFNGFPFRKNCEISCRLNVRCVWQKFSRRDFYSTFFLGASQNFFKRKIFQFYCFAKLLMHELMAFFDLFNYTCWIKKNLVNINLFIVLCTKGSLLNNDSPNYDTNNSRSQSPANVRRELPSDLSEEALEREAGEFLKIIPPKI